MKSKHKGEKRKGRNEITKQSQREYTETDFHRVDKVKRTNAKIQNKIAAIYNAQNTFQDFKK